MQFITNNIQLLFVIAIVGFSVLSWIVSKLKEQAILRQQQKQRERMRFEALRTGRMPTTPQGQGVKPPEEKLAELAARRAELIRRGRAQLQAQIGLPQSTATTQRAGGQSVSAGTPVAAGPVPPPVVRPTPRQGQPRPAPGQTQRPVQGQRPAPTARATSPAQRRQEIIAARRRALEAQNNRPRISPPAPERARAPEPISGHPAPPIAETDPFASQRSKVKLTRARLREAMILREIVDPPIALRGEGDS